MPARDRVAVRRDPRDPALREVHSRERSRGGPLKILISAAEASSDLHGAHLLRAIREAAPPGTRIDAFGVGGPKLQAEGLRAVVDARELLVMGFTEIVGRLPRILRALDALEEAVMREKPAVVVVIDYADFHFRLARRLKRRRVPIVYYIPPKVWVWRKKRLGALKELFARVLCVFPFEEKIYAEAGIAAKYVGNPLADELPLKMTRAEARANLGLSESDRVVVLMPGSRPAELKRHLTPMLEAAKRVEAKLGKLKILMPLPETADLEPVRARVAASGLDVALSKGDSATALIAADAGLIKSGTSTLEAGVLGCPHAVVYRSSAVTHWIFKNVVKYKGAVGLVNLFEGQDKPRIAREILMEEVTAANLAQELESLLTDEAKRAEMKASLIKLRERVLADGQTSPSLRAAREILSLVAPTSAPKSVPRSVR